ncbi:MAG: hypothetical protein PHQ62_02610 [Clostridia bacterium]|nr:hypothetical protein [Clostridia bacterium]
MEDIYNQIVSFITLELDPLVRILIVGIFLILGLLNFKNVVKIHVNSDKIKFKIMPILLTIVFIFLAVFVASV